MKRGSRIAEENSMEVHIEDLTREEYLAFWAIFHEYRAAKEKHPQWVSDPVHAAAIMGEEAGEAVQAALDFTYAGDLPDKFRKECAQTGAMAIRCIVNMAGYRPVTAHIEAAQAGEAK